MGWLQTSYPRVPLGSSATVTLFTSLCSLCLFCFFHPSLKKICQWQTFNILLFAYVSATFFTSANWSHKYLLVISIEFFGIEFNFKLNKVYSSHNISIICCNWGMLQTELKLINCLGSTKNLCFCYLCVYSCTIWRDFTPFKQLCIVKYTGFRTVYYRASSWSKTLVHTTNLSTIIEWIVGLELSEDMYSMNPAGGWHLFLGIVLIPLDLFWMWYFLNT